MALYTFTSRDNFAKLNRLPRPDETKLYNAIAGGQATNNGATEDDNFFVKRGKSIENALGTTGAAVVSGVNDAIVNKTRDDMVKNQKQQMNDVAKKYGYNTRTELIEAHDRAVQEGDTQKANELSAGINEINNVAKSAGRERDKLASDYKDYAQNDYISKKVNQDRGKFAGSAINTLSTMTDVMLPTAGIALNTVQGGVEGIADELEQNGLENFDWGRAGQNALIGATTGAVTGAFNKGLSNALAKRGGNLLKGGNKLTAGINKFNATNPIGQIGSTLATGAARGAASGAVGGATGAGLSAAMNGQDVLGSALQGAVQGAQQGATTGGIMAGVNMAANKTPGIGNVMRQLNEAGEDWNNRKAQGQDFNQRLTETLTSGDSAVGEWLQGNRQSRLLNQAGEIGNRVQNTGSTMNASNLNNSKNIVGFIKEQTGIDLTDLVEPKTSRSRTYTSIHLEDLTPSQQSTIKNLMQQRGVRIEDNGGYGTAFYYDKNNAAANMGETLDNVNNLTDSTGRKIPAEIAQRLANVDPRLLDENGNIKVMYHGTPNGGFERFDDGSYFTEDKTYADGYQNPSASSLMPKTEAKNPMTYDTYIDAKKLFDINDSDARKIYIDNYVKGGNANSIDPYRSNYDDIRNIDWTEVENLREFLSDHPQYGYDGIIADEGGIPNGKGGVTYRGQSIIPMSGDQVIMRGGANQQQNPTTLGGWLKKAGQRVVEDVNNTNLGNRIKNVAEADLPDDIRNLKVNYGDQTMVEEPAQGGMNAGGNGGNPPRNPATELYNNLNKQPGEPIDITDAFGDKGLGTIERRNKLQALGQQLQNSAKTQKYAPIYDSLDAKTARRAAETNAPQRLADLGVNPQDYNEYAKTSSYVNRVVSDLAKKSGVKLNVPDLPSRLSADNIDVVMSDPALKKYNGYIKQIVPDGDSPVEYSASYLLEKSRELGDKAANLRGNTDDVNTLRQALTDAKWTLRNLATDALEGSGITGDLTNDNIAVGLKNLGANEAVQDYYTAAVDGKAPSVAEYIKRSSLFEQARDMGNQIDAEKYTRSASKAPTRFSTKLLRATGLEQPIETLLRNTVAPVASGITNTAGKAIEGLGNAMAGRIGGGNAPTKAPEVATNTNYNPQTRVYNAIGRTEGLTNAEQARTADYLVNAAQEAEIVPNTNNQTMASPTTNANTTSTSLYNSVNGNQGMAQNAQPTQTNNGNSLFPVTGDYWTDMLGRALTAAINADDVEAFGQLFGMYQEQMANLQKQASSSSNNSQKKLTATQQRANAAMNSLNRIQGMTPDLGYNLSQIPVIGNIATLGGNDYEAEAKSLAQQIGYMVSGANIKEEEAYNIGKAYVPQPFDNETTRRNKLQRAREIIEQYQSGYAE